MAFAAKVAMFIGLLVHWSLVIGHWFIGHWFTGLLFIGLAYCRNAFVLICSFVAVPMKK